MKRRRSKNELVEWRARNELSQRKACLELGCSRMAWMGWETGEREPPKYIRLAMLAIEHGLAAA